MRPNGLKVGALALAATWLVASPSRALAGESDELAGQESLQALEILLKDARGTDEQFRIRAEMANRLLIRDSKATRAGSVIRARAICEEGLQLKGLRPDQQAVFLHLIGQSYLKENPKRAMESFEAALKLSRTYPGSSGALLALAEHRFENDEFEAALALYVELEKRAGVPREYVATRRGFAALKLKKFSEADEAFTRVLARTAPADRNDAAIEGLATASAFTRNEADVIRLANKLFPRERSQRQTFVSLSFKRRAIFRKETEAQLFDYLLSFATTDAELDRLVSEALAPLDGAWGPGRLVACLEKYRERKCRAEKSCQGKSIQDSSLLPPIEREVGRAMAAASEVRGGKGSSSKATLHDLEFLIDFVLSLLPRSSTAKDAALLKTDLCRTQGDFSCLESLARGTGTGELLPKKVRLSLQLEAALKGQPVSQLASLVDARVIREIAETMRGEKLWLQVVPQLIQMELKKSEYASAAKWASAYAAEAPKSEQAETLQLLVWSEAGRFTDLANRIKERVPGSTAQAHLAPSLMRHLKSKAEQGQWAEARQVVSLLVSLNKLSKKEKSSTIVYLAAQMALHDQQREAAKLLGAQREALVIDEQSRGVVAKLLPRLIAWGDWSGCLDLAALGAEAFAFERSLCRIGSASPTRDVAGLLHGLKGDDRRSILNLVSLFHPEELIKWSEKVGALKDDEAHALYFAFQNQQRSLFPALGVKQYERVKRAAPSFVQAGTDQMLEAEVRRLKFPSTSLSGSSYLEVVVRLQQKSAELQRRLEAEARKGSLPDLIRACQAMAAFERDLAKAIQSAPSPAEAGEQQKRQFRDEMRSLASKHTARAEQYAALAESHAQKFKSLWTSLYPSDLKLTEPGAWQWPAGELAEQIRNDVRAKRFAAAFIRVVFARSERLVRDDDAILLKALVELSASRSEPIRQHVLAELESQGKRVLLERAGASQERD